MPYEEHKCFEPIDDNQIIWRYLDFAKFIDLLNRKQLFFCRIDQLQDKFEGYVPNIKLTKENFEGYPYPSDMKEKMLKSALDWHEHFHEIEIKKSMFINCWHINQFESSAMRDIYCGRENGIAIKTTFDKLKESFSKTERKLYIGKVKYIDNQTEEIPKNNLFNYVLHKRKFFEHENELRVVTNEQPEYLDIKKVETIELTEESLAKRMEKMSFKEGIYSDVDINSLIDKIVISPHSKKFFEELLKSVVPLFGMEVTKIEPSGLIQEP